MNVGFVGLGAMGRAMATNLIEAGHRLRVWNRSAGRVEELRRKGAEAAAEPREAFGEVLVSMLADDTAVRRSNGRSRHIRRIIRSGNASHGRLSRKTNRKFGAGVTP